MPGHGPAALVSKQPEAIAQPIIDLLGGEQANPGGGEFDGERDAVEPPTDAADGRGVRLLDPHAGHHCPGAVQEQPPRLG